MNIVLTRAARTSGTDGIDSVTLTGTSGRRRPELPALFIN